MRASVWIPRGTKEIVCIPGYPLRTWMAFLREPPRDPLAIVEALVTYAEHNSGSSSLTLHDQSGTGHNP